MDDLHKRAQVVIRKLTAAGFLPESLPEEKYLLLWNAVIEGLKESDRFLD